MPDLAFVRQHAQGLGFDKAHGVHHGHRSCSSTDSAVVKDLYRYRMAAASHAGMEVCVCVCVCVCMFITACPASTASAPINEEPCTYRRLAPE